MQTPIHEVKVTGVRADAFSIPTDLPEADGTFAWHRTTLVVVEVDAGGMTGIGYTYTDASAVVAVLTRERAGASITERAPHGETATHIAAGRAFNRSSALLALSVLTDSGIEHYRGSFANKAMFTPLVSSALSLLGSLHGAADSRARRHPVRHLIYLVAGTAGAAGTGFHLYNVLKRPGGWSWNNLFYAAPIGAPTALLLSGALGAVAERLRDEPAVEPQLLGMAAGRALGLLAAAGLIGTVGEVALMHFRGSYQNVAMYAPVTIAPVASALLVHAALAAPREHWIARAWLRITAALGFVGMGFHARGIARNQGGWRNWTQNILNGPPLPAPPSFSALALAGLAALRLRETEK